MLIRMVVRSESVGTSFRIQLDMAAKDIGERTRLQKVDNPHSAFAVSSGIFNQQAPGSRKSPEKRMPVLSS